MSFERDDGEDKGGKQRHAVLVQHFVLLKGHDICFKKGRKRDIIEGISSEKLNSDIYLLGHTF